MTATKKLPWLRRHRRAAATALTVSTFGALTLGSAGIATASPPDALSGAAHTYLQAGPGQSAATGIAEALEQRLLAHDSSRYVGEVLSPDGSSVTVYLTKLDSAFDAALAADLPLGTVHFARAPRSMTALNQLHQQAIDVHAALQQQGINVVTWGPDIVTGRENMTVQDLTPAKTATIQKLLGASNVHLTTTSASYTAEAVATRAVDSPPWNGGDFLQDYPVFTGECTSGFGAHSGTTSYMITAGHCFPASGAGSPDYAVNGAPDLSAPRYYMGPVQSVGSFRTSNGLDAEIVNTTSYGGSSKAVFTGSSSAPQVASVAGKLGSPLNAQVCQSGAFEGEICGLVIKSGSECITEAESQNGPYYTVCNVFEADNTSGGIAVGNGDSGGPVFRFSGASLYATGIITAQNSSQTGNVVVCPKNQYPNVLTTRYCGSKLYYTNIAPVLTEFGLTLNT